MTPVIHDTHARPAQLLPEAVMPPAVIGQWRSYFGFGGIVGLIAILVGFSHLAITRPPSERHRGTHRTMRCR